MNNPFRLGVLGSGKGSNFVAIADAIAAGKIPAEVALVLSDVESAGILAHARDRNIPAQFIPPGKFRTKLDEDAERAFVSALQSAQVDLIVLAGFMRVLKGEFLRAFEGRIVNIHPSLLPSFPGLEAWKQALDHGVKVTGCTVHFADAGVEFRADHRPANRAGAGPRHAGNVASEDSCGRTRIVSQMRSGDCVRGDFGCWTKSDLEIVIVLVLVLDPRFFLVSITRARTRTRRILGNEIKKEESGVSAPDLAH